MTEKQKRYCRRTDKTRRTSGPVGEEEMGKQRWGGGFTRDNKNSERYHSGYKNKIIIKFCTMEILFSFTGCSFVWFWF